MLDLVLFLFRVDGSAGSVYAFIASNEGESSYTFSERIVVHIRLSTNLYYYAL